MYRVRWHSQAKDENTDAIVVQIGRKILEIQEKDVEILHRLPANKQGKSTIIARFWNYKIKQNLYRNRTKLKDVTLNSIFPGMSGIDGRVYINESLTKKRRAIYSNCLKLSREEKMHSVWTMDGKIVVKMFQEDKLIKGTSLHQKANL